MSNSTASKSRLGRGLASLLPAAPQPASSVGQDGENPWRLCPLDRIRTGRQPRSHFDEDALEELADSIRASGLLQPLVVRPDGQDRFTVIAGERRFRACRIAGLDAVPVVIRDVDEGDAFALALLENLQREDLTPLEEAEAFRHLIEGLGLTQDEVARRVGRSRAAVANSVRLLRLPETVRNALDEGRLSSGHARALLGLPDDESRVAALDRIENDNLTVRQLEALVRDVREAEQDDERTAEPATPPARPTPAPLQRAQLRAVERQLMERLSARVSIRQRLDGAGVIEVQFADDEGLQAILDRILE
ncbi:MAG: ParB/RepB/Spo0J family partition protein [Deltaproteobacteria bacterium]|nr:MAG: ParB/RepB/Spo0J family partition protein [Deltaproteobacteria bacterium]